MPKAEGRFIAPFIWLFAGFMYLTDTAHLVIEQLVQQEAFSIGPYVIALLLLYVLMIPAFFIVMPRVRRKAESSQGHNEHGQNVPADARSQQEPLATRGSVSEMSLMETCNLIARSHGLSKRQAEVMLHLATGRDVNHIAKMLGLAPNTVRSYRKSLYASLDIHGLQELLDLIEERAGSKDSSATVAGPHIP